MTDSAAPASPVKVASTLPVSADLAADAADLAAALARTPEEWAADARNHRMRLAGEVRAAQERHAAARARVDGVAGQVLDLHGPRAGGAWVECHGCEFGGHDGEPPEWPCQTWALVAG